MKTTDPRAVMLASRLLCLCVLGWWLSLASPARSEQPVDLKLLPTKPGGAQSLQHLFKLWSFDSYQVGHLPTGFSARTIGGEQSGSWAVEQDPEAPTPPNVLVQQTPCLREGCLQVLLVEGLIYEYPDVAIRIRAKGESQAAGGVVFAAREPQSLYAVIADLGTQTVEVLRVLNGNITTLGRASANLGKLPWHLLRVQRNTILSKEYMEVFFDNVLLLSIEDKTLGPGLIGLVTKGEGVIEFDNLHAAPLYSQKPLSPPAAY